MKNIQISKELFVALCNHHLNNEDNSEFIVSELNKKLDKLLNHILFTEYKTAPKNSAERELARKKYLDSAGISEDYRSDIETAP